MEEAADMWNANLVLNKMIAILNYSESKPLSAATAQQCVYLSDKTTDEMTLIATWWLAAVYHKSLCLHVSGWDMAQTKKAKYVKYILKWFLSLKVVLITLTCFQFFVFLVSLVRIKKGDLSSPCFSWTSAPSPDHYRADSGSKYTRW